MISVATIEELLRGPEDSDMRWFRDTPGTFNLSNFVGPGNVAPGGMNYTLKCRSVLASDAEAIKPPGR